MVNRQGRVIAAMFQLATAGIVVREAGLAPTTSLLNNRQRRYGYHLLVASIS